MVRWERPQHDGGVEIDDYTLSLHQEDHQTVYQTTTESLELPLPLHYSTVYSLSITANNCAGTSPPVTVTSMEGKWQEVCVYHNCGFMTIFPINPAGCQAPSPPVDGSIDEYRSTEEGAEIQFTCTTHGPTPNEWIVSQCLNSSWSPDPRELVCALQLTPSSNAIQPPNPPSVPHFLT